MPHGPFDPFKRKRFDKALDRCGRLPHNDGQDRFALVTAQEMLENGASFMKPMIYHRPYALEQANILFCMAYVMVKTEQIWVSMTLPSLQHDNDENDVLFLRALSEMERTGTVGTEYIGQKVLMAMSMATLQEISTLVGDKHIRNKLGNHYTPN